MTQQETDAASTTDARASRRTTLRLTIVTKRIEISTAVMLVGLVIGTTSFVWWFAIGSVSASYSSLLVGHVIVAVGLLLNPSRGRSAIALLLAVLMWWPVALGDHI